MQTQEFSGKGIKHTLRFMIKLEIQGG